MKIAGCKAEVSGVYSTWRSMPDLVGDDRAAVEYVEGTVGAVGQTAGRSERWIVLGLA